MRRFRSTTIVTAVLAALAMQLPATVAAQDQPLRVLSTIGMVADLATTVGGSCVAVSTLIGPGTDPHLYRASAQDVRSFQDAELVLYSGYSLEGQLGEVLEGLSRRTPTIAVTEAAVPQADMIATGGAYGVDPHAWMDVALWALTVPVIADAIIAERPGCAEAVAANAATLGSQLDALHNWVGESLATVPERQRILVTAHDAFAYYARAYAIEVAGIQGISTEAEASIADIRGTAAVLAEREIPAIFVETTINPRTVQAVIDAAGQLGHSVAIGGQLYADAMGEAGTPEGTYIGMIWSNTRTISSALGGETAPLPDALDAWADSVGIPPENRS